MKLCVPSWQLPGSWLYNVEKLAAIPWIEGIELLFFSFDEEARKTFAAEREGIAGFADRFFFSLHLPDILSPDILDLVDLTAPFVELYVFHPFDGAEAGKGRIAGSGAEAWAKRLKTLRSDFGKDRFAMEYTAEKAFEGSLAMAPDIPLCADTGCILRNGLSPLDWILKRSASIAEIHLHAAKGKKDHFPLSDEDQWVAGLAKAASTSSWRVEFETFSLEESDASHDVFRRFLP